MKKRVALFLVFLCLTFLFSCSHGKTPPQNEHESRTEEVLTLTAEDTSESYPYDLSQYIILPDPIGVRAKFSEPGVLSDAEVEEAIFLIRLAVASFEDKTGPVEEYDKVTVSFELVLEGETLEEETDGELELIPGTDNGDGAKNALAQALVGAVPGDVRWADYTYPVSVLHGSLSGKTVVAKGTVTAVQKAVLPECDEAFVHSMEGFEDHSVKEFYAAVKKDILEEKEKDRINAVWASFCQGVTVLGYPEAEVNAYREDYVSYYTEFAQALEMELEAFLGEYMETDLAAFQEDAQAYAREMVKNDMIFVQLSRTLQITLTQEEFQEGAAEYYAAETMEFDTLKDFIDHYSEESIRQNLIRDKALMVVVENAVRTE